MASVTLGIIYTPDDGAMPLILGRLNDPALLIGAVRCAVAEADGKAAAESNIIASRGYREQATALKQLLGCLADEPATVSTVVM